MFKGYYILFSREEVMLEGCIAKRGVVTKQLDLAENMDLANNSHKFQNHSYRDLHNISTFFKAYQQMYKYIYGREVYKQAYDLA